MDLIIIRHGRPERVELTEGEVADPALTDRGWEQARAVADMLMGEEVHAVVSSPVLRARQTAEPLSEKLGVAVQVDDRLAELDFGNAHYIPAEEMNWSPEEEQQFIDDPHYLFQAQGGFEPFRNRVVAAFDDVIAANRGRRVAVFCHGGVMGSYLTSIIGTSEPFAIPNDYCSVMRVAASSTGIRTLLSVNETLHVRHLLD